MGKYDSTLTRVIPFFDKLSKFPDWVDNFLKYVLNENNKSELFLPSGNIYNTCYGKNSSNKEKALPPPDSLLIWMIENIDKLRQYEDYGSKDQKVQELRKKLFSKDKDLSKSAIEKIRSGIYEKWFIFEGKTYPDIFIETDNYVIVAEGKRTERGRTTKTTWLNERDQLIRHMDGAYDEYVVKKNKRIFGFLILEENGNNELTKTWKDDLNMYQKYDTFVKSLPHRSSEIIDNIFNSFTGYITWQKLGKEFNIKFPD